MTRSPSRHGDAPCPIARTAGLIEDRWTTLIMREAFGGARRFDDFVERLALPRATLTKRLDRLVEEGMLIRSRYHERPDRFEYRLTPAGRAFYDVLAAMWSWGQEWRWAQGDEPPLEMVDRSSGEPVRPVVVDEQTGERLDVRRLRVRRRRLGVRD